MIVQVNGLDLYVERAGAGRPLLLLHGFTGSADEWAGLTPALAGRREVIAVDLLGHGRSAAPDEAARYTMERCVADLLALLDELGVGQAELLGYSMGGRVALQLAAAAPERVGALILESASPGIADPAERAARVASDAALAEQIEARGLGWFADHWAGIPLFASQAGLPAETRAALRERRMRGSARGLANSLRGMGAGSQTSLWAALPGLTMPTQIISGALDAKYVAVGAQAATLMPDASHTIIPRAGHTLHLEAPQAFEQVVVGFLDQRIEK